MEEDQGTLTLADRRGNNGQHTQTPARSRTVQPGEWFKARFKNGALWALLLHPWPHAQIGSGDRAAKSGEEHEEEKEEEEGGGVVCSGYVVTGTSIRLSPTTSTTSHSCRDLR
ncbi:hypothetical protein EYF80_020402 [Liparis tanakae]|uniref:Uncharacterized protein n=1 Tax=Liparis tanakae TaxID=230148 RepID=A0A4Z2HV04_9TELE|nr:hypothetical protein EYF80_020402 [Liparis tanakae]